MFPLSQMLLFPHRSLYLLEGSLFRRHIVTFLHRCFLPLKKQLSDLPLLQPSSPVTFLPSFLQPESLLQPTSTQQHPPLILMLTTSRASTGATTATTPVCASRGSAVVNVLAGGSLSDEVHMVVGGQDDICHTSTQAREATAAQGTLSATCKMGHEVVSIDCNKKIRTLPE